VSGRRSAVETKLIPPRDVRRGTGSAAGTSLYSVGSSSRTLCVPTRRSPTRSTNSDWRSRGPNSAV
jgi:hypothetical protein